MKPLCRFLALTLFAFTANAQIINIPDANFKAKLLEANENNGIALDLNMNNLKIDANSDGEIDQSEALAVRWLFYVLPPPLRPSHNSLFENTVHTESFGIADLTGIEYFTNIEKMDISNNLLTTLDVSTLVNLDYLECSENQLTTLNVTGAVSLRSLVCSQNQLTSLNVAGLTELHFLYCHDNELTTLDISNLPIWRLACQNNQLTNIQFGNNDELDFVYCYNNQLSTLDLSGTTVAKLYCQDNPGLTYVNLKNGVNSTIEFANPPFPFPENSFNFTNLPLLQNVCCDQGEVGAIEQSLDPSVDVTFNPYCTFVPGGSYNTITGIIAVECASANQGIDNVRVTLSDGVTTDITYTDSNGAYTFYTLAGTFTITPEVENSAFFGITPGSANVTFATTGNTQTADFCVSANGTHHDVEVSIIPVGPARPGFDAAYKIILHNKGNQAESGTVGYHFNDAILDFVSANPIASSINGGDLTWDYTALLPFESREITVILNLNAPTEIPAVNVGDVISSMVETIGTLGDEFLEDNWLELEQVVVGAVDPNDKAVAEGAFAYVDFPAFLHYTIRFQNVGTAPAENVVIKDVLSEYLDPTQVQITSASHNFRSTITEGNVLEFFFNNINLPAEADDEPGSHGYVTFKVKFSDSASIGDVVENSAAIYFDFNFPVITNTTSTTLDTVLASTSFLQSNEFSIHPNPANDLFYVNESSDSVIETVTIYNSLGQAVKMISVNSREKNAIPIADLQTGVYFVQVKSVKNISTVRLLKR